MVLLQGLGALLLQSCIEPPSGLTERTSCTFRDADVGVSLIPCASESFPLPGSAKFHEVEFGGRTFGIVTSVA